MAILDDLNTPTLALEYGPSNDDLLKAAGRSPDAPRRPRALSLTKIAHPRDPMLWLHSMSSYLTIPLSSRNVKLQMLEIPPFDFRGDPEAIGLQVSYLKKCRILYLSLCLWSALCCLQIRGFFVGDTHSSVCMPTRFFGNVLKVMAL